MRGVYVFSVYTCGCVWGGCWVVPVALQTAVTCRLEINNYTTVVMFPYALCCTADITIQDTQLGMLDSSITILLHHVGYILGLHQQRHADDEHRGASSGTHRMMSCNITLFSSAQLKVSVPLGRV